MLGEHRVVGEYFGEDAGWREERPDGMFSKTLHAVNKLKWQSNNWTNQLIDVRNNPSPEVLFIKGKDITQTH